MKDKPWKLAGRLCAQAFGKITLIDQELSAHQANQSSTKFIVGQ